MGLALLQYEGGDSRETQFRINLGANRFWMYAIGDEEKIKQHGIDIIQEKKYTSPMFGPLPEHSRGRGFMKVPSRLFDRRNRNIQLISFRGRNRVGPAFSEIYLVPQPGPVLNELPAIEFKKESKKVHTSLPTSPQPVDIARCNVLEENYSQAKFLNFLGPALQGILPQMGNLLGPLLGGGGAGGAKVGAGGLLQGLFKLLEKPETVKSITDLVGQIAGGISGAKSLIDRSERTHIPLPGYSGRYKNGNQQEIADSRILQMIFPRRTGHRQTNIHLPGYAVPMELYSHAQVAWAALIPMIAQLLPALMPAITKVLDGIDPNKVTKTVTESVEKIGKLGLQGQKQLMGHLEKTLPKLADEEKFVDLMKEMSASYPIEAAFKRVDSVKLSFPGHVQHILYGTNRILYRYGQDLTFPMIVETPRTIKKATLQALIKNAETLEVLDRKKWPLQNVVSGLLKTAPKFQWSRLSSLKAGDDYILNISLTWKNKQGKRRGTSHALLFRLAPDYSFDHVEEAGELLPLNDPTLYRDYWHKIWQTTFTPVYKKQTWHCRYYYTLENERSNNARMETLTREAEKTNGYKEKSGQLKSGMILSPNALVQLISRLKTGASSEEESPGEKQDRLPSNEEMAALMTSDFIDRFNQAARTTVKFRGKDGQNVQLWAYPVVKLQRVILKKIASADPNGHVQELEDHAVHLPMPVLVKFVGLSSE